MSNYFEMVPYQSFPCKFLLSRNLSNLMIFENSENIKLRSNVSNSLSNIGNFWCLIKCWTRLTKSKIWKRRKKCVGWHIKFVGWKFDHDQTFHPTSKASSNTFFNFFHVGCVWNFFIQHFVKMKSFHCNRISFQALKGFTHEKIIFFVYSTNRKNRN